MFGSSIVKNAFLEARKRPGGVNLGLGRIGVEIWWQGRSWLRVSQARRQIRSLLKVEDMPNIIVIHMAGNDIGQTKVGFLRIEIKNFLNWLAELMPETAIVWSQILPRTQWRFSQNLVAMENVRVRLNSSIASFVVNSGGHYVRYPDIQASKTFLCEDGVHLTPLGNNVFLNTLQGALETILSG